MCRVSIPCRQVHHFCLLRTLLPMMDRRGMFIDYFCCVPQCFSFVSATSTHVPPCLSATSLFEWDPISDVDRAVPTCAKAPSLASHEGSLSPSRRWRSALETELCCQCPDTNSPCSIVGLPTQKSVHSTQIMAS